MGRLADQFIGFEREIAQTIRCIAFREKYGNPHLTEVRDYILTHTLLNEGEAAAEQFLRDWGLLDPAKVRCVLDVHKFVPGDHYHVDDRKFDSLAEAKAHLERIGADYGQLVEKHVYARGGD